MKDVTSEAQDELDAQQNRPIELYDIYLEAETLHLTTYHDTISFFDPDGTPADYTPIAVERGPIEQDVLAKAIKVTCRIDNINQAMASYAATSKIKGRKVTIRQVFLDAMASADDAIVILKNALIDAYTITESWLEATLTSSLGSLNIEAPRWHYQLQCNRKFASADCGVDINAAANKKDKTLDAGSTQTVLLDAGITEGADYWNDGECHILDGALAGQKRRIVASQNGQITVQFGFTEAPATGVQVRLYRGCDKTFQTCKNRFANQINYGGFDTIPQELVRR